MTNDLGFDNSNEDKCIDRIRLFAETHNPITIFVYEDWGAKMVLKRYDPKSSDMLGNIYGFKNENFAVSVFSPLTEQAIPTLMAQMREEVEIDTTRLLEHCDLKRMGEEERKNFVKWYELDRVSRESKSHFELSVSYSDKWHRDIWGYSPVIYESKMKTWHNLESCERIRTPANSEIEKLISML